MFEQVFPKVFAFASGGQGSNCFLLRGERETALIDSSTLENREEILSGLSGHGLGPEDISLVLHTHGHADHFGLDKLFTRARIAMHRLDAEQINKGRKEFACLQFFPGEEMPHVSVFLDGGQKIDLGGLRLEVVHTPGHTSGSTCFFLGPEKALFSGDTLFAEGIGRTDLLTGSSQKMAESLEKLKKMAPKALFPGHGPFLLGRKQISNSIEEGFKMASTNAFL